MSHTRYFERGKVNPFDAYMAGCSIWYSPRQIIILEKLLCEAKSEMFDGVDAEAYEDMLGLIKSEAEIKRKKYL